MLARLPGLTDGGHHLPQLFGGVLFLLFRIVALGFGQ
jgi:hypothetical protein